MSSKKLFFYEDEQDQIRLWIRMNVKFVIENGYKLNNQESGDTVVSQKYINGHPRLCGGFWIGMSEFVGFANPQSARRGNDWIWKD